MDEPFSNPIAPPTQEGGQKQGGHGAGGGGGGGAAAGGEQDKHHPLTNDDFRKLLMTPRPGGMPGTVRGSEVPGSVRGARKGVLNEESNENKKKKKKFYAAIKKQEEDTLAELARKYRDRAKERRDGANPDYQSEDPMGSIAAYRAVAPDIKSVVDAAERRKQMIEESKFLGGDMAHTHLVKGLDYALLQKVKAEIHVKADDDDEEDQKEEEEEHEEEEDKDGQKKSRLPDLPEVPDAKEDIWAFKSLMANNIYSILFKNKPPERNDLFLPSRMAYVVDLEEEGADDIPTTAIRSKADCPDWESASTLSTNDIVINKLTQILSYLRQGGGKKKKKDKIPFIGEPIKGNYEPKQEVKKQSFDDSIYGDIGDYVPVIEKKERKERDRDRDREKRDDRRDKDRDREKDRDKDKTRKSHTYFDKPSSEDDPVTGSGRRGGEKEGNPKPGASGFGILPNGLPDEIHLRSKMKPKDQPESYAECYPGAPENDDAILDSDDEVDYSKMDMGNKKGTIGRWDFDTAEEYGDYMSNKEALPKAAFQYGVKMADGRKTRRISAKKDEKAKIDRDLQKINALISKRKAEAAEMGGNVQFRTPAVEPENKRHKF